ncbi:hypothetical protein KP509_07G053700 [Ceratopteris richardii]|uniref:Uncharacterized protein n=1 Tax=Ceratopteris richardii TaxID=49495 RepID=A0A8T2U9Z2_CERRI|nr:hypothetical protein KP509_07G053700 [Ceratopteris richardii]
MAEVLAIIGLGFYGLEFLFQAKRYIQSRKERKRKQKQETLQNEVKVQHEIHNHYYITTVTTPIDDICGTSNHVHRSASFPSNLHHISATSLICNSQPRGPEPSAPPLPAQDHSSIKTMRSCISNQILSRCVTYPAHIPQGAHQWWYGVSQKQIGGRIDALAPPQAQYYRMDAPPDFAVSGIRIGSDPNPLNPVNTVELARIHWSYFEKRMIPSTLPPSVAVVCWEHKTVDMFMLCNRLYYKNYRVYSCSVDAFSAAYHGHEVFSGEIVAGRLKRCNREIKFLEPSCGVVSTNSWLKLGLNDRDVSMHEYDDAQIFVNIAMGALFGLLCCLYPSASNVSIDMKPSVIQSVTDIVACINSHNYPFPLFDASSSIHFSVFSFNNGGWTNKNVLIG